MTQTEGRLQSTWKIKVAGSCNVHRFLFNNDVVILFLHTFQYQQYLFEAVEVSLGDLRVLCD